MFTNIFSTVFKITNYSLPFSQDSFQETLWLINYYIPTIPSVRLLILGKKWELSFAISAKHLTESGIGGFYISYLGLAVIKWFSSYLSNRRQCVILSGTKSDWEPIQAGVPQGSILRPLLFLIFINNIVNDLSSSIRLVADDTSLYIIVENPQTAARLLNLYLDIISNWPLDWVVDFNARKTISLLLSTKLVPLLHPQLFMNNTVISESSSYKHLGIAFSSTCSWTEHISKITESAWIRLNLLRALKYKINRKALEKIYLCFYTSSNWV